MYRRSSPPPPHQQHHAKSSALFRCSCFSFSFRLPIRFTIWNSFDFRKPFSNTSIRPSLTVSTEFSPRSSHFYSSNLRYSESTISDRYLTCYHHLVIIKDRVVYSVLEILIDVNQPEHYWSSIILVFIIHTSSRSCDRKPPYMLWPIFTF